MTIAHAITVACNMREVDKQEIYCQRNDDCPLTFAYELAHTPGESFTCLHDGVPVAVGGVSNVCPGVGQMWLIATDQWPKVCRELTKFTRNVIAAGLDGQYHRLQVQVAALHEQSQQWLTRSLGFEHESIMKNAGKNGEDFYMVRRLASVQK